MEWASLVAQAVGICLQCSDAGYVLGQEDSLEECFPL